MKKFVLKKGDKGQEVKRLQINLGGITVDGNYGKKTKTAVKAYQIDHGLTVDGIAGSETLTHLRIPVLAGIDVSHHNGTIDWKKVAESGVKFAWIKCSEGTTWRDKSRLRNLSAARKAGLIVGGYHFARPDNGPRAGMQDAKEEADNYLMSNPAAGASGRHGDLLPVLDLEAGVKTDDNYNAEWALKWCEVVEDETGAKPIIYCAKWATDLYLKHVHWDLRDLLAAYPCWWASYNTGVEPKRGVALWRQWDVWQWTGSGKVRGIKGKCDKNWMAAGQLNNLRVR